MDVLNVNSLKLKNIDAPVHLMGVVPFSLALISCLLLSILLDTQPFAPINGRFIGHGDQAQLAAVARNIAEGRGPLSDCVWILREGGRPGTEIRQPEGYWSIYVAHYIALLFKFFGSNRATLLLGAALVKCAIALLTSYWVFRLTGRCFLASLAAAIFILFDPHILSMVNGLSDIYLTFGVLLSATTLVLAIERHSSFWAFLGGTAIGLSIGVKPTALLLVPIACVTTLFHTHGRATLHLLGSLTAGLLASSAPLALHNLATGGSILWPDLALVRAAQLDLYLNGVWNRAAYDPATEPVQLSLLSLEGLRLHLGLFRSNFFSFLNGKITPIWLLPLMLFAIYQQCRPFALLGSAPRFIPAFSTITFLVLASAGALAFLIHDEPRYFKYILPFIAIAALTAARSISHLFILFAIVYTLLAGGAHYWNTLVNAVDNRNVAEYTALERLLPSDAKVLTPDPWEFSFHTRRLSVALPYTPDPQAVLQIARRYSTTYLVIINKNSRHPTYDSLHIGPLSPHLEDFIQSDRITVAKFKSASLLTRQLPRHSQ